VTSRAAAGSGKSKTTTLDPASDLNVLTSDAGSGTRYPSDRGLAPSAEPVCRVIDLKLFDQGGTILQADT